MRNGRGKLAGADIQQRGSHAAVLLSAPDVPRVGPERNSRQRGLRRPNPVLLARWAFRRRAPVAELVERSFPKPDFVFGVIASEKGGDSPGRSMVLRGHGHQGCEMSN